MNKFFVFIFVFLFVFLFPSTVKATCTVRQALTDREITINDGDQWCSEDRTNVIECKEDTLIVNYACPPSTLCYITKPKNQYISECENLGPLAPSVRSGSDPVTDIISALRSGCGNIGQSCCAAHTSGSVQLNPNLVKSLPSPLDFLSREIVQGINFFLDSTINKFLPPFRQYLVKDVLKIVEEEAICYRGRPEKNWLRNCICVANSATVFKILCDRISSVEKDACNKCTGVYSAFGCLEIKVDKFIKDNVFKYGLSLGGIFSLLCIIYSAFQLQTSQGNPEKIKKAQELLTSCIMGLMLIIFSVFILRLIGVNVLKIPGFN